MDYHTLTHTTCTLSASFAQESTQRKSWMMSSSVAGTKGTVSTLQHHHKTHYTPATSTPTDELYTGVYFEFKCGVQSNQPNSLKNAVR